MMDLVDVRVVQDFTHETPGLNQLCMKKILV